MNPRLPLEDQRHLEAAEGWIELGNIGEANLELDEVTARLGAHPDVLEVRWEVFASVKDWEACVDLANALVNLDPERPSGWIKRSFALHELKRTQEAIELLLPAAQKFPAVATIAYNLACYACQLGWVEEARSWLQRAFKIGNGTALKLAARDDPDLEPLWSDIWSA